MTQPPLGGPPPYRSQGPYAGQQAHRPGGSARDTGPGPTRSRLPVVLAGLIALVGLAIAVVIVVVGRSGPDHNQASEGGRSSATSQSTKSAQGAKSGSTGAPTSGPGSGSGGTSKPTGAALPSGFPVPDGVDISGYDSGGSYNGLASVGDPQSAYDFWVDQLPKAGYKISDKTKTGSGDGFIAQIKFSGKGLSSASISFLGTTCAVQLTK